MEFKIYDKSGNLNVIFSPSDSSIQQEAIQGENILSLSCTALECVPLNVNDYTDFLGRRYRIIERYIPKMKSEHAWNYSVKLYGPESLIRRFLVIKRVDGDDTPVFSYTAPASEQLSLIVSCINSGMGTLDWKVGEVVSTGNIVMDYNGTYCNEALGKLAEKSGTEYWIDGTTINISRCEHGEAVPLAYGEGLVALDRDVASGMKFFTRLLPYGSSRNIVASDYGYSRLQLPSRAKYVEQDTELYGVIDHFETAAFADIYPRRIGKVSSVRSENRKDKEGTEFTVYYFKDDGLDFDPNDYEIAGLVKHVSFQEGSELAGMGENDDHYFEVNYDSGKKEFEIITQFLKDGETQIPGGLLIPAIGDEYILWNIRMPESYYPKAEKEYEDAVNLYMAESRKNVSVYKLKTDYVELEKKNISLTIGRRIKLISDKYFPKEGYRISRITKITRKINRPTEMELEVSDVLSVGRLEQIDGEIEYVKDIVKTMSGSLPGIIKTGDRTPPTDNNLFSALRSLQIFVRRDIADILQNTLTFLSGIIIGNKIVNDVETGSLLDNESTSKESVLSTFTASLNFLRKNVADTATAVISFIKGLRASNIDVTDFGEGVEKKTTITPESVTTTKVTSTEVESSIIHNDGENAKFYGNDAYLKGKIGSKSFAEGFTGFGWEIDKNGNAWFNGVFIRNVLNVPEFRFNRISVIADEQWSAPGGGIIEKVEGDVITLRLEEGEAAALEVDDICKGIFHTSTGFSTSFFRITSKVDDSSFRFVLRSGYTMLPCKTMHFVAYGNFTNKDRQKSAYTNRKYLRFLSDVNNWEIEERNIRMQLGDLEGLRIGGVDMKGYSAYLDRVYMKGVIKQLSGDGVTYTDIGAWKGEWSAGKYYNNDEVTHNGSTWRCISETTTQEPSDTSTDWLKIVSKGEKGDSGENAKTVVVNVDAQAFTYQNNFATLVGPQSIKLSATLQATTGYQWSYKLPSQTSFTNISGATAQTYTLAHDNAIWGSGTTNKAITIRCTSGGMSDEVTIVRVSSGANGNNGDPAKVVVVNSNAQVFSYTNDFTGTPTPSSIALSATLQGVSGYQWSYKLPSQTTFTNISGATSQTYTLAHNSTLWGSGTTNKAITIRCTSGGVYDEVTVARVSSGKNGTNGTNGAAGADAYTVLLSNESHTFEGDTTAALAGSASCDIIAYKGATQIAATIGTITGAPTGMSVSISNNGTTTAKFTVTVTTSLTTKNGVLTVPITVDGKSFTKKFSWALATKGIKGADGRGVVSTAITYQLGDNGTTAPTGSWSTSVPTLVKGKYLWTRSITTYTSGDPTTLYTVSYIAKDGSNGNDGIAGKDGVGISTTTITYAKSTSNTTHPTSGWSSTIPSVPAGEYLWTKTVWKYTDNTTEEGYSVAKQGESGSNYSDNLLVKSDKGWENTSYPIAAIYFGDNKPVVGEKFTATMWGAQLGNGKTEFRLYNSGGYVNLGAFTNKGDGVFTLKGTWKDSLNGDYPANSTYVNIYPMPSSVTGVTSKIGKVKFERGWNDNPVWTPNSADLEAYTIVLGNESHTFSGSTNAALAGSATCSVIAYKGATRMAATVGTISGLPTGMTSSVSNNGTTSTVITFTVTTSMTTASGVINIPVTVDGKSFTKVFSYAISFKGATGASAKVVIVNSDAQAFAYTNDFTGTPTPSSIALSATLQGVSGYQWSYKLPSQTSFTNISGATSQTYSLAYNASIWGSGTTNKVITIRCTSGGVYDEVTVARVSSGKNGTAGEDAYTMLLSNESHIFVGGTSAALAGSTSCNIIAYKGATQIAATIGTITGAPTGMSVSISNNGTTTAKFTVTVTTSLTTKNGVLTVPITVDGKSFSKNFSWSLALKGATGAQGLQGKALRIRGVWSANTSYVNNTEFRDIVIYNKNRYICNTSHTSTTAAPPNTNWGEFNQFDNVATSVLLADDGYINVLGAGRVFIGEEVSSVDGWEITKGEIRHTKSGLKLTADGKLYLPDGLKMNIGNNSLQQSIINISKDGLQGEFSKLETSINEIQTGGDNLLLNGDLRYYTSGYNPGWDTSLNGNLKSTRGWDTGYNNGVPIPGTGYHAHFDINTFGFPVIAQINRNNQFGQPNRWIGIQQTIIEDIRKKLLPGQKYVISFEMYSDVVGGELYGGPYHYNTGETAKGFKSGQFSIKADVANKWKRYSAVFTLHQNTDLSKDFNFYIYGNKNPESSKYIRNISLQLGTKGDFNRSQYDLEYDSTLLYNEASDAANAAQTAANNAQSSINNLKINSRNYILNSEFKDVSLPRLIVDGVTVSIASDYAHRYNGYNSLKVTQTAASNSTLTEKRIYFMAINYKVCKPAFFSAWVKGDRTTTLAVRLGSNSAHMKSFSINNTSWTYVSLFIQNPSNENVLLGLTGSAGTFYIACPMLAESTKAVDWSPAPEDTSRIFPVNENLLPLSEILIIGASSQIKKGNYSFSLSSTGSNLGLIIPSKYFNLNKTYVVSFMIKLKSGSAILGGHWGGYTNYIEINEEAINGTWANTQTNKISLSNNVEYNVKVCVRTGLTGEVWDTASNKNFYIQPNHPSYEKTYTADIWNIKLEEGPVYTGWKAYSGDVTREIFASISATKEELKTIYVDQTTYTNKVDKLESSITQNSKKIALKVDSSDMESKLSDDRIIANVLSKGLMLKTDPTFDIGLNGVVAYNTTTVGTGAVVSRVNVNNASDEIKTIAQGQNYLVKITGTKNINNNFGGWGFAYKISSEYEYVAYFRALIPVGFNVLDGKNNLGTGGSSRWVTKQNGTGKWEDYFYYMKGGDVSSTQFYFYITKSTSTSDSITWYLSYATIYQLRASEMYTTITKYNSGITVLSNQISSKVEQTTFNTLKGTVEGHTTSINQTSKKISLLVDGDNVSLNPGVNILPLTSYYWEQGTIHSGAAIGTSYESFKAASTDSLNDKRIRLKRLLYIGDQPVRFNLKTHNPTYQFCVSQFDSNKAYLGSAYFQTFTTVLIMKPSSMTIGDTGSITVKELNEKTRYLSIVIKTSADGNITNASAELSKMKIESGNTFSTFSRCPTEDMEMKLYDTGIDIEDGSITLTADKFKIQDNKGVANTVFETVDNKPVLRTSLLDIGGFVIDDINIINKKNDALPSIILKNSIFGNQNYGSHVSNYKYNGTSIEANTKNGFSFSYVENKIPKGQRNGTAFGTRSAYAGYRVKSNHGDDRYSDYDFGFYTNTNIWCKNIFESGSICYVYMPYKNNQYLYYLNAALSNNKYVDLDTGVDLTGVTNPELNIVRYKHFTVQISTAYTGSATLSLPSKSSLIGFIKNSFSMEDYGITGTDEASWDYALQHRISFEFTITNYANGRSFYVAGNSNYTLYANGVAATASGITNSYGILKVEEGKSLRLIFHRNKYQLIVPHNGN